MATLYHLVQLYTTQLCVQPYVRIDICIRLHLISKPVTAVARCVVSYSLAAAVAVHTATYKSYRYRTKLNEVIKTPNDRVSRDCLYELYSIE